MNAYQLLILSLPTANATARMRAWRALKNIGAAVLRDGVYLLPATPACHGLFDDIAGQVRDNGGSAYLLRVDESSSEENPGHEFAALFDRSADYAALQKEIDKLAVNLATNAEAALKQARKLEKTLAALIAIDYLPGPVQAQTGAALAALTQAASRALAPDEPGASDRPIARLAAGDYQGRTWATRQRPWVDRLASAWLIHRFIDRDPRSRILWLAQPADCPADALGFDFDGATFSHVGHRVTFEVLLASFGLDQPELLRLGALVHYLDVGGEQPPEAEGIETLLAGLRAASDDDHQLLAQAMMIFDGLLTSFSAAKQEKKLAQKQGQT